MSDPKPEEAQLTNLSDDYIRELEPENQRYDITLAQDFVISVLPNGIKTWAFIYDFQGRHRRKTLGVFPEMNFNDAKVALEKARASMLRMDEPTVAPNEFGQLPAVLGGSRYSPKRTKQPVNYAIWIKLLGGLLAIALIAFAAMKTIKSSNEQTSEQATEQDSQSGPFAVTKRPTTQNQPIKSASSEPLSKPNSEAPPESTNNSTSQSSARAPETTTSTTAPGRSSDVQPTPQAAPTRPSQQTTASTSAARPQSTSNATPQPSSGESRPVTTLTTTTKATAFGGRVARSRLTSRVQDLEPTDTLGPEISYKNSGYTRVFYFTELREFGEGNVVHRWSLNGEVHDEVVLTVKPSWRWRTYSNKDITPGLNGEWKVETIDATGKILDTETFTYDYQ